MFSLQKILIYITLNDILRCNWNVWNCHICSASQIVWKWIAVFALIFFQHLPLWASYFENLLARSDMNLIDSICVKYRALIMPYIMFQNITRYQCIFHHYLILILNIYSMQASTNPFEATSPAGWASWTVYLSCK